MTATLAVGPGAPMPWTVPLGAGPQQYRVSLIDRLTMDDLKHLFHAKTVPEPGYEGHAAALARLALSGPGRLPPVDDLAELLATRVLIVVHPGEALDLAARRLSEQSVPHAVAFDDLIFRATANPGNPRYMCRPVDLLWCLSFYDPAKPAALAAINALRGVHESIGGGYPCDKCEKLTAVLRPIQTSAGDEGTKMELICMNRLCNHHQIMS
jgi:hypothetical protein